MLTMMSLACIVLWSGMLVAEEPPRESADKQAEDLTPLETQQLAVRRARQYQREFRVLVKELLERARQARQAKRYVEAARYCEAVLRADPAHQEASVLLRQILKEGGLKGYRGIESEAAKPEKKSGVLPGAKRKTAAVTTSLLRYPRDRQGLARRRRPGVAAKAQIPRDLVVQDKLKNRVSLDFAQMPLSDVLEFLRVVGELNIFVDQVGLKRAGVTDATLVNLKLTDIPIETALRFITKPLKLAFGIRDGVLVISDLEGAQGKPELVIYDVRDLMVTVPDFGAGAYGLGFGSRRGYARGEYDRGGRYYDRRGRAPAR